MSEEGKTQKRCVLVYYDGDGGTPSIYLVPEEEYTKADHDLYEEYFVTFMKGEDYAVPDDVRIVKFVDG